MSSISQAKQFSIKAHWFFLVAPLVLLTDASAVLLDSWQNPRILEAGLLFDLAVLIPLLYLWCYRSRGKQALTKSIALACLGIWAAGNIVPEANHIVLAKLGFLRYVGLAVLIAIEVKIVTAIYRATFASDASPEHIASQASESSDMPLWVAKIMAWEAKAWRKLWSVFKGGDK